MEPASDINVGVDAGVAQPIISATLLLLGGQRPGISRSLTARSFLTQIYPPTVPIISRNCDVDIVAVHGLDPFQNANHAFDTWTASNGKLWLRDFLPEHATACTFRVLLYSYNSSAVFGASIAGIEGAAENLLNDLRLARQHDPDRPIIFVCHSLGGIVAEKAIVKAYVSGRLYRPIHDSTKGIAFFGTPHRGGNLAVFGDRMAKFCRAVTGDARNSIMEALRKDSMFAGDVNKDFARRADDLDLKVLTFIETLPIMNHIGLVVPRSSAALDWGDREIQVFVEATHRTICKFERQDDTYRRVAQNIIELIESAVRPPQYTDTSTTSSNKASEPIAASDHRKSRMQVPTAAREDYSSTMAGEGGHGHLDQDSLSLSRSVSEPDDHERGRRRENEGPSEASAPPNSLLAVRAWFSHAVRSFSGRPPLPSSEIEIIQSRRNWPLRVIPQLRPEDLVKREALFERILIAVGNGPLALYGIGGSGKSQLALQLAHWFLDRDPDFSVCWICANGTQSFCEGYRAIAAAAGIGGLQVTQSGQFQLTKKWLESEESGRWLVIVDSADEARTLDTKLTDLEQSSIENDLTHSTLLDLIPKSDTFNGQVIFTTKTKSAARKYVQAAGNVIEVGKFSHFEAVTMLNQNLTKGLEFVDVRQEPQALARETSIFYGHPDDNRAVQHRVDAVSKLIERLDCLPLALSQAIAYINRNELSVAGYLARIEKDTDLADVVSRPEDETSGREIPNSIYSTLKVSYDSIRRQSEFAINVLSLMSFLDQFAIPTDLLLAAFDNCNVELDEAIQHLRDYTLIENGLQLSTFNVHPLVQSTTQKWLKDSRLDSQWASKALSTLSGHFPTPDQTTSWPQCQAWLPHAIKILQCHLFGISQSQSMASLQLKVGWYYHQRGDWSIASQHLDEASTKRSSAFGPYALQTLEAKSMLVDVLRQLGDLKRAEEIAREVKRHVKRVLGRDNEITVESYLNLAISLRDQGRYKEAKKYAQTAMKGFSVLRKGSELPESEMMKIIWRLGILNDLMGEFSTSEALLSSGLEEFHRRRQGNEYAALRMMNRLAWTQRALGKYEESERTARACSDAQSSTLGPKHPDTLKSVFIMALSIQRQSRHEEAFQILSELRKHSTKGLGQDHLYTLTVSHYLAESMVSLGNCEDAKDMHENTLARRMSILPEGHPDILSSRASLANVMRYLEDFDNAEKLSKDTLEKLEKQGGLTRDNEPIAWICIETIAKICAEKGALATSQADGNLHWRSAIKWGRRLVGEKKERLGIGHPETRRAAREYDGYLSGVGGSNALSKTSSKGLSKTGSAEQGPSSSGEAAEKWLKEKYDIE